MTESAAGGIYLHQLVAREEAAIKRVIAFSGSQGRNYHLTEMSSAQIIVVSDDTPVDLSAMNPDGSTVVRIVGQDSTELYDVLMTRPLLVTKVMRILDEASALMQGDSDDITDDHREQPSVTQTADDTVAEAVVAAELDTRESDASQSEEPEQTEEMTAPEQFRSTAETLAVTSDSERDEGEATESDTTDSQYKALVVDDSAAIRKQLELELRAAGIDADFAESGEEALEKLAANHYNLIFLDIIMPGIDGYETCRQMRLRNELKKTPIIMLSAKTSPLDEVQGVIAGASTYLTKPVKSEQLQSTLKRVSMWLGNFQENKEAT